MNAGLWLLAGSTVGLAAVAAVALINWKREQRRHERTALLANEYLALVHAHIEKDRREASVAATERRIRVIAFPEQPAPFKTPPWGSTFPRPIRKEEMN